MSTPLRANILALNYSPEHTGIAPYATGLATGLADRGLDVRVLTAHPHYPGWEIQDGYGAWTTREQTGHVSLTRLRHYVPAKPRGVRRLLSELSFGMRLLTARHGQPDATILVSPALFASALGALRVRRGTSLVVWVQDIYSLGMKETGGSGAVARIIARVESRLLRRADHVVVIHERFADYVHHVLQIPRERITVIRNWTHLRDRTPADRQAVRQQLGWGADECIVLHTGNMGVKQGLENVVAAARAADESSAAVRFVLVGDGSERKRIAELAEGVERVNIVPPLDDDTFAATLDAADILLVNELAGVSEMAVPSKLTSYFSAAQPVLAATDPGGTTAAEIFAADAGVLVPAGDPIALLDGALRLAADETERQRLGRNGRAYRETVLAPEIAIDKFAALLTDFVASARTHT